MHFETWHPIGNIQIISQEFGGEGLKARVQDAVCLKVIKMAQNDYRNDKLCQKRSSRCKSTLSSS